MFVREGCLRPAMPVPCEDTSNVRGQKGAGGGSSWATRGTDKGKALHKTLTARALSADLLPNFRDNRYFYVMLEINLD